jgi:hypothetical protein
MTDQPVKPAYQKTYIFDTEIKGQLSESVQKYRINYIHPVYENEVLKYTGKIELAFITPAKNKDDVVYHSLRFTDPDQVKMFINELMIAYAYFLKRMGKLNEYNFEEIPYIMAEIHKGDFKRIFKGLVPNKIGWQYEK